MNRKNLETLLVLAARKGMLAMPVTACITSYRKMKKYKAPKTSIRTVKYPKLRLSYIEMENFKEMITKRKQGIERLIKSFNINALVFIGGSLSLKYQLREFYDRDFHDVDIVIHPRSDEDKERLGKALSILLDAGAITSSSKYYPCENNSFEMGSIMYRGRNLPINIIVGKVDLLPFPLRWDFNAPCDVIEAKKGYIKKALAHKKKLRDKDLIDLYKINN